MNYEIIATGSDGNATLIDGKILIDIGVPMKQLKKCARYIQLVILTHKHCDHFKTATVKTMARIRPGLRWACCEWMVQPLVDAGVMPCQIDVIDLEQTVNYEGLAEIRPEKLTHGVPNCCWHIQIAGERLFFATDTGTLDGIDAKGYDIYMVEANHTTSEIEERAAEKMRQGVFSYEIRAAENHLSYEQAVDWLVQNMGPRSVWLPMHQHKSKITKKEIISS